MGELTIALPGPKEIFPRLRSIAGNTAELNKFYMRLFKYAGQEVRVDELVTIVITEIAGFTTNMSAIDMDILVAEAPKFIDALADVPLFAELAKNSFRERMSTMTTA